MRKAIVAIAVSVGIFLCAITAYGQQLTDWEYGVYYDLIKNIYFCQVNMMDDVYSEIASRYSISVEKLKAIENEGLKKEPTRREWEIYDELYDALEHLPEGSGETESKRLYGQIADKYGLSQTEVYEIYNRCSYWEFCSWF